MNGDERSATMFFAGIAAVVGAALLAASVVRSLGGDVLLMITAAFLAAALALAIAATPSEV